MKNIFLVLLVIAAFGAHKVHAQGERKAILFTGYVVEDNSGKRLPGTYIRIPRINQITLARSDAFFSIPVFPGDSIVFSYVGYKNQYHVIPRNFNDDTYTAVIGMREKVTALTEVRVYPYSTEEEFKKAFLAMELPDKVDRDALAKSTDLDYINRMAALVPNSAATNYRYNMDQYMFGRESAANRGFASTMPFLNPFAWAKFIKSVKDGDLKRKDYQSELNRTPVEAIQRKDLMKGN